MNDNSGPSSFNLGALQAWAKEILAGLEHPPLGMAAALAEECGEVATCLLDHHAYGKPLERDLLGDELVDVLVCLLEIASHHGIDLEVAADRKLRDIAKKAPEWRELLAEALKKSRGV